MLFESPGPHTSLANQSTADNPFAWDTVSPDVAEVIPQFDEIADITRILRVSHTLALVCGGLVILLLIYLIITKTPQTFKPYSRLLLVCAVADFGFWMSHCALQVKPVMRGKLYLVSINGLAQYLPYNGKLVVMSLAVLELDLICTILPTQYYFRYVTIKRGTPPSGLQTVILFGVSFAIALLCAATSFPAFKYSAYQRPGFNYGTFYYKEWPLPSLIITDMNDKTSQLYFMIAVVTCGGAYILVLILGALTVREIKEKRQYYTEHTIKMQKTMNKALLVQSIMPIFTTCVPIVVSCTCSLLDISLGTASTLFLHLCTWTPTLDSYFTIMVISPYRRAFYRILRIKSTYTTDLSESRGKPSGLSVP